MLRLQVAVTKRKEEEECSSSVYASMDSFDPVMNFQSYIDDNESIVDEVYIIQHIDSIFI